MASAMKNVGLWLSIVGTIFLSGVAWGIHQKSIEENGKAIACTVEKVSEIDCRVRTTEISVAELTKGLDFQKELLQEIKKAVTKNDAR